MPSGSTLVSIIMPTYNCEKYISQSIKSILNQSYTNWELLIADDCSTDNTYSLVNTFRNNPKVKIVRNKKNIKQVVTRNILLQQAKGELIAFQDADDWSTPDRIEKQVNEFENDKALAICGTFALYYDETGIKPLFAKRPSIKDDDIKKNVLQKNQFCGASIMIRKEILEQVGSYREYFSGIGSEDYDLTSRIAERFKAMNIGEELYCVRLTYESSSRGILSSHQWISEEIVKEFIKQRREMGVDYLESDNLVALKALEAELLKPYASDPSLQYRKAADHNWYIGNKRNYIKSAYLALTKNPYEPLNWKYFIHAISRLF